MSFGWECVLCCIGVYPTSPSSPPALRSGAGSTRTSTIHALDLLCCVCANVDGLPLQKSVKIANSFSLYFAILMGVRVTPAVLHTVSLQIVASLVPWNSKAVGSAPDQTATFPKKSLFRLLAVVVGVGVRVGGLVGFIFPCFLWT